jgi:cold shock CspA family protein
MQTPLELKTRNLTLTEAEADEIRDRAARLDHFYEKITRCRVTVEGPGPHHRKGPVQVRVDLTVPGSEIVVTHQSGEHLNEAVKEAFNAAGRRLEDYVRRTRRYVKVHEPPPAGRVVKLFREAGYGFLESTDGREVYFHRNSVAAPGFDQLDLGAPVRFAVEEGEKGPQATAVEAI